MGPVREIALIAGREFKKNVRSAKGLIIANLSFLIGTAVAIGIVKINEAVRERAGALSPEQLRTMRVEAVSQLADPETAQVLADVPAELLALLTFIIWLSPLLVVLMGFDAISGDLQHRTVRYWALRARRSSYYVGKILGIVAVVAVVTLIISSLGWTLMIVNDVAPAGATISWGLRLWSISIPITLAWAGIGALVASQFRTPILSLLTTLATFFTLWLFGFAIAKGYHVAALSYAYPNTYDFWMLSAHAGRALAGASIPLAMAAGTSVAGALLFARRDL